MFPARDSFSQSAEQASQEASNQPWPETTPTETTTAPRWQIQTAQEETESRSQIEKLEQPDKDICEDSGSDADDHAQFETDEGLSLLWNQRHEDLDHALKQRKQQDVYTQTWYHYLSCYVCCQPSVISS
ncbi:hypothetical protein Unana1_03668 [Umbelopsis nana]